MNPVHTYFYQFRVNIILPFTVEVLKGEHEVLLYRVSIKSFPGYKHLLQENCVEYKHIFLPLFKLVSKILCHVFIVMLQLHNNHIPHSFLVISVRNQGKTLCSPCISLILKFS